MQCKSTLFLTGVEIKQTKLGNFFVVIPELLVQLLVALFGQPGVMQKNVSYCISEKKIKIQLKNSLWKSVLCHSVSVLLQESSSGGCYEKED